MIKATSSSTMLKKVYYATTKNNTSNDGILPLIPSICFVVYGLYNFHVESDDLNNYLDGETNNYHRCPRESKNI